MKNNIRTYSKLSRLKTFEERFEYLKISGRVGSSTFGSDRYLNQKFYHSIEWRKIRDFVITRDLGCDLGIVDRLIPDKIYIHHINPIELKNFSDRISDYLDPEFLICCSFDTHQAIHYGFSPRISSKTIERFPYDTCPWKNRKEII